MAARRLLIVMLFLLGVSVMAAALLPPPPAVDEATETEETEAETPPPAPDEGGRVLSATLDADAPRLQVVKLRPGDQLSLLVTSQRFDQVEIPALGVISAVAPGAPARFEILAREPTTYAVRLIGAQRLAGRIVIEDASGAAPRAPAPAPEAARPGPPLR